MHACARACVCVCVHACTAPWLLSYKRWKRSVCGCGVFLKNDFTCLTPQLTACRCSKGPPEVPPQQGALSEKGAGVSFRKVRS